MVKRKIKIKIARKYERWGRKEKMSRRKNITRSHCEYTWQVPERRFLFGFIVSENFSLVWKDHGGYFRQKLRPPVSLIKSWCLLRVLRSRHECRIATFFLALASWAHFFHLPHNLRSKNDFHCMPFFWCTEIYSAWEEKKTFSQCILELLCKWTEPWELQYSLVRLWCWILFCYNKTTLVLISSQTYQN